MTHELSKGENRKNGGTRPDLVLQVVPPVRPRLSNASFLFQHGTFNDRSKDRKRHSNSMIIVAMDARILVELFNRLAVNLQTIIELLRLNTKLG